MRVTESYDGPGVHGGASALSVHIGAPVKQVIPHVYYQLRFNKDGSSAFVAYQGNERVMVKPEQLLAGLYQSIIKPACKAKLRPNQLVVNFGVLQFTWNMNEICRRI